uniref:MAGE domain-containing protein n=1 Tax=Heliothis virescens TaxID=7102 RepID=A0A2A4K7V2_HELVI
MSQRRTKRSTQAEQDRSTSAEPDISDLEESIKECVRYIICREGSKIPIKRAEIIKHLNTTCQTPSNMVKTILVEADKIIKRVYGYKLIQVEAKSGIQYIVVLTQECDSLPSSAIDGHHRKLLIAALMHIFMSGAAVKEEEMWKFLMEAGLLEENDHAGRKLMTTTFTRQMYLQYRKVGEGDLARNVFLWGQRAVEEVPKLFLLGKMAEAFDKTPDHWCEQYKEATEGNAV